MGDDGSHDLCECINSGEAMMRRLLGILRQSQSFCTDNLCSDDFSLTPRSESNVFSGTHIAGFIGVIALVGIVLFGLPGRRNADGKRNREFDNFERDPPAVS